MNDRTLDFGYYHDHKATLEDLQRQVGPGWAELIERCFNACYEHNVRVAQVKEKFGGLRFYVDAAPMEVYDVIDECERLSYEICEKCGKPGKPRGGGWVLTLCDECALDAGRI
jgi:hypothetical protein